MDQRICDAINNLQLISLGYNWGSRTVEPHAYGRNDNGEEFIRVYQVSGASESGKPQGWKLLNTDDITSLTVLSENFSGPRHGYRRGDKALDARIYCQL